MGQHHERRLLRGLGCGAAAGAAGTTALNAVTYLDMALRGRPPSSTPEQTVERLEEVTALRIPGGRRSHENRVAGIGPLTGIAVGVGTGLVLGVARALGWRPGLAATAAAAGAGAIVAGTGPMTALGVTDPRRWSATSWVSDLVPHAAYGLVVGLVLSRCP